MKMKAMKARPAPVAECKVVPSSVTETTEEVLYTPAQAVQTKAQIEQPGQFTSSPCLQSTGPNVRVKKTVIPMVLAKNKNRRPSRSTIMAPKMAVA